MKLPRVNAISLGVLACALPLFLRAQGEGLGPVAVAAARRSDRVYVAAHESHQLLVMTLQGGGALQRKIDLGGPPTGMALNADESRVLVTVGLPEGYLAVIDADSGNILRRIPAGHTPTGVSAHPTAATAWVFDRFRNRALQVNVETGERLADVALPREPVAGALTPDGGYLLVANLLPTDPANLGDIASAVTRVSTADGATLDMRLPDGGTNQRGLCLGPGGQYAYSTHTLGRYTLPTTHLDRGWIVTNAISIFDVGAGRRLATVLLDEHTRGAANPWGIAVSPDGKILAVASSGSHEIHLIDLPALHAALEARLTPPRPLQGEALEAHQRQVRQDLTFDLAFLRDLRRRVPVHGNGPRNIAWQGSRLLAGEYFSDSLAVLDRDSGKTHSLQLAPAQAKGQGRSGEMFFHDARFCYQQWLSCASCHPDARSDALNWDLLNDGIGNGKQAKTMVNGHRFSPAMLLGVRGSFEQAIRKGLEVIQFSSRPEEDAMAIEVYLKSLEAVPSPRLVKGELSESAKRGRMVYDRAGCNSCHILPETSDRKAHDVGTLQPLDAGKAYITPHLLETWRNGPWLNDGRAATMLQVLREHNPDDRHGRTSGLSEQELHDLAEFVLSL